MAGHIELRFQPSGIAQQHVEFLALAALRKLMRKIEIVVAASARVGLRIRYAIERRDQLLVLHDKAFLAGAVAQEVSGRVVQTEETLSEIAFEQQ